MKLHIPGRNGRTSGASAKNEPGPEPRAERAAQEPGPGDEVERAAPDTPTKLPKGAWGAALKGSLREFKDDELTDRAAALTYYGVLSLFPALLVLVSLLGVVGKSATDNVLESLQQLAPGAVRDIITRAVEQLEGSAGVGSIVAVVGLVLAVWSASGYVAAFIRSANAVYDMPEGRPIWKVLPVRVGMTVVLMVLAVISSLIVVFTGGLARRAGDALGLGDTAVTVWSIAKWPVLVVLVTIMIALLYWAAPNTKIRGFRWITPGSLLALVIWLIASAGFAFYVANFASYNKTYGTMAGVIVFLVWLWITNLAILLGLEFDAEIARQRAIAGGHPPEAEPYTRPRDTQAWDEQDRRRMDEA
ncbi:MULTISPECIES: YihY/virulence factor BrkB family protein [Streptomyces]|uniref:YihY/virulence factor BrkB family protein n=2 Tax=Streptomyces viridosporus TaxID=67581 RepID=A0ABX6A8N6_STRVD|nr:MULTISPECIES: YihY/virulence factor BrkB family protein [Streptomyces]EFE71282.1 membrane protein [Streptomyces viridosporus ATCC 14672]PWJ08268.1 YihY/virulence factor BrkB family protein [Streptomyces sp. NWU49]QEU84132.1 YihY/virulence factor BrkB family protein [Streptomyces viridosporus T7A]